MIRWDSRLPPSGIHQEQPLSNDLLKKVLRIGLSSLGRALLLSPRLVPADLLIVGICRRHLKLLGSCIKNCLLRIVRPVG